MKRRITVIGLLCIASMAHGQDAAQPQTQKAPAKVRSQDAGTVKGPGCAIPEYSQLEFWVGEWDVEWKSFNGKSGKGRNKVERKYGGCVYMEQYVDETTDFSGTGLYTFRRGQNGWLLTWMDNQGGVMLADGGPPNDDSGRAFVLAIQPAQPGQAREGRFVFENVKPDSLTWKLEGRENPQSPWFDVTVSQYRRRK